MLIKLEANSVEFLDELYKVTPPEHHILIDDWFKKVITYDLSAEDSISERRVLLVEAFFFGQEIPEAMQEELAELLQLIPSELLPEYMEFFS